MFFDPLTRSEEVGKLGFCYYSFSTHGEVEDSPNNLILFPMTRCGSKNSHTNDFDESSSSSVVDNIDDL